MIAEKKCRGTGKAVGHGCKEMVDVRYRKYGLGVKCGCYHKWLLNTDEGAEIIQRSTLTAKNRVTKDNKDKSRKEKAAYKEENKSIKQLTNDARLPFQKFIRMRDANNACISCGLTISALWDAGHFYKAELYTGLIFDEANCHKQCRKCNSYLGGNENNYRVQLIEIFGQGYVDALDEKAKTARLKKYTKDELRAIRDKYKELLKNEIGSLSGNQ